MNDERILNGGGHDDSEDRTVRIERVITHLTVVCKSLDIEAADYVRSLHDHKGRILIEWKKRERNTLIYELIKHIWEQFENEYECEETNTDV
jgi:hypothetical protein